MSKRPKFKRTNKCKKGQMFKRTFVQNAKCPKEQMSKRLNAEKESIYTTY